MVTEAKLSLINEQQIKRIHETAIEMLDRFGIDIGDKSVRDMMLENGCKLIHNSRVQISRELIDAMIKTNKQKVVFKSLFDRELVLETDHRYTHTFGGAAAIIDLDGNYRRPTGDDLVDAYRLNDYLDNIDMACALVYPSDLDRRLTQYLEVVLPLLSSLKPVDGPGLSDPGSAKYIALLCDTITNGDINAPRPFMINISPQSPFIWPKDETDCLSHIIKSGIPTTLLAAPMAGMTSPLSVIGCVTQCHAEILAYGVLYYLFNPETPRIYASRCFFPNMRTCKLSIGLPENAIAGAITAQLATYCGFLSDINGGYTTGCATDAQIGYEKMLNCLLPLMAGATMITGAGSLGGGTIYSPVQHVIDDEIFGRIMSVLTPREINSDAFGFDALEDVIIGGYTFLEQPHTVEYLKSGELFAPTVSYNDTWVEWQLDNMPDIRESAAQRAREILAKHEKPEPDANLVKEINLITESAKKELLNK